MIYWRNNNLNFKNPNALLESLEMRPKNRSLIKTQDSLDENVLRFFLKKGENNNLYFNNLELLWECCQIPDFEKKAYGQHINVVDKVYRFLSTQKKKIPNDYMKEQLKGLEKDHGNIDVLSHRISNVRTWSYVANKKNWVENSDYWVQLTKDIEDKLSDKLHDELTRSFIDKKISVLSRNLKQDLVLKTEIDENNKIIIDGQLIGELKGLTFSIAYTSKTLDTDIKSIKKAARKGIKKELTKRVEKIIENKEIALNDENKIIWNNNVIAKLKKGYNYLSPEIEIIADESLESDLRAELENFLNNWLQSYLSEVLGDLLNLTTRKIDSQYLRALAFQLYEKNGLVKRNEANQIVKLITNNDRKKLWGMGIKIGDIIFIYQKC